MYTEALHPSPFTSGSSGYSCMFHVFCSCLPSHDSPLSLFPSPHVFLFHVGSFFKPSLLIIDAIVASGLSHTPSPPSRHHRPSPPSGSVGVQPAPLRDVVGAGPVTDQAPAPGVGGPTHGVGDLGGSGQRPQSGSLRPLRSDRTVDPGPSRDSILSPVDRDRQEVLEDGELHDGEESCQDGEELADYAPPSSSTMTPEPEMIDYWKSSIPSFSSSASFRPLSSVSGQTKKWSSEAAPVFAPPR